MSDPSSLPPYLPDLIGDETVAETMLTHDGCQVVVTYRPAVLIRTWRAGAGATVAEAVAKLVVDGTQRYPAAPADELDPQLVGMMRAITPTLGTRCTQWVAMFIRRHPQRVLEAKRRYEQGQG